MKSGYRPYWCEPIAYVPIAIVAVALLREPYRPLRVYVALGALLVMQAVGLYLVHRDFMRRDRELKDHYRKLFGKEPPP